MTTEKRFQYNRYPIHKRANDLLAVIETVYPNGLTRAKGSGAGDIPSRLSALMAQAHPNINVSPAIISSTIKHLEDEGHVLTERNGNILAVIKLPPKAAPEVSPEAPSRAVEDATTHGQLRHAIDALHAQGRRIAIIDQKITRLLVALGEDADAQS